MSSEKLHITEVSTKTCTILQLCTGTELNNASELITKQHKFPQPHTAHTWSKSCFPVVLLWMANSSSASAVETCTLTWTTLKKTCTCTAITIYIFILRFTTYMHMSDYVPTPLRLLKSIQTAVIICRIQLTRLKYMAQQLKNSKVLITNTYYLHNNFIACCIHMQLCPIWKHTELPWCPNKFYIPVTTRSNITNTVNAIY